MRKRLVVLAVLAVSAVSSVQAAGGVAPALATCFLGNRVGLEMNEGKAIETNDWIRFVGGFIPYLGEAVPFYTSYVATKDGGNYCVAFIWGHRPGREFKQYKLRTMEILECIPIVDLYPCIALPLEAYSGKTMSDVVKAEGLAR
jgi:hypothetical protein